MLPYNIVEAHCHVMELTSSGGLGWGGGVDEQFTWHRNQEQNVSASGAFFSCYTATTWLLGKGVGGVDFMNLIAVKIMPYIGRSCIPRSCHARPV